jgi:3-deoxy-D-manno-octulosonic-acid transferase
MAWIFNVAYLALLAFISPWLLYCAIRKGKYRQGWSKRLLGRVPRRTSNRPCVWLHAVSVGEVNLLDPLLSRIEREYPGWDVVISSTTATGYALAQKRFAPRTVFYAPLDFSWAVSVALGRLQPDVILLAELEVWPNLVRAAKRRGVKVAVVNGRLSDKSFHGYRRFKWLLATTFARLDLVVAQNDQYAARFRELGCAAESVDVSGSLKFDGAQSDRHNETTQRLARLAGISSDDIILLAGSTQAPEESLAIDAFKRYAAAYPNLKLLLVPRHPERFAEVAQLLERRGVAWERRSELETRGHDPQARVLLVDAVGELAAWWGTARIAFVGGSMGSRGGQNMIEPAAYGAAVCFGPNTWNFRDVAELLVDRGGAVVVRTGDELTRFIGRCLTDPGFADALGEKAATIVRSQQGAADRTIAWLRPLFGEEQLQPQRSSVGVPRGPRWVKASTRPSAY